MSWKKLGTQAQATWLCPRDRPVLEAVCAVLDVAQTVASVGRTSGSCCVSCEAVRFDVDQSSVSGLPSSLKDTA
jgi:hypothetical protein